jgi:hypothetical protein
MHADARPEYSPENRSSSAGKIIAIATLTLLILGSLATLLVVLNRGRSGIDTPPQIIDPRGGYNRAETPYGDQPTPPPAPSAPADAQ